MVVASPNLRYRGLCMDLQFVRVCTRQCLLYAFNLCIDTKKNRYYLLREEHLIYNIWFCTAWHSYNYIDKYITRSTFVPYTIHSIKMWIYKQSIKRWKKDRVWMC